MAKATLTAERARELLDYDPETGVLRWRVSRGRVGAGEVAGTCHSNGYLYVGLNGKKVLCHRLAWFISFGSYPKQEIDHINGDRADNRICNLRLADVSENKSNRRKQRNNTSGFKGVSWCRRKAKWHAQIRKNKRSIYLGYFACPTAAHIAYCKAADEHHGEYARTA